MNTGEWNWHDSAPKQKHDPEAGGHTVDPYNPMSLFRQYMRYRPAITSAAGRGGLPEEPDRAGHGQVTGNQERNPFQFLTQRPRGPRRRGVRQPARPRPRPALSFPFVSLRGGVVLECGGRGVRGTRDPGGRGCGRR
ncbi:hypothetical protein COCSUDRAFT_60284 [Coccomyxa subellipsoidea C-169]|uniref:Uncharacterized protein n=1 Tax=Coccomyxa subellipsoidea (strain C-169) TaxID=574566 RepID=I0YIU5_COCSC|nr:hypothetical protein COCSUDRAFT_60284 [Coccomyxa subellipsoidea C-169]EIE18314.1 hypothetical protein COCSUDRAFT_60284 [Coccomyxa subellipsoidea C-169]|eukprot:XP_005642858.1 hypothetical protein COCSUDRAFT_60284 [Coccomyxa subellipsoidea C-169]